VFAVRASFSDDLREAPGDRLARLHPARPCLLHRASGSSNLSSRKEVPLPPGDTPALTRCRTSLTWKRHLCDTSPVDPGAASNGASLRLQCPSAYIRRPNAFSSLRFREAFWKQCLAPKKSHPQGLATLSVMSARSTMEAFFSPPRSWAFPYEVFLRGLGRAGVSSPLSAPALPCKTSTALHRCFSGFIPTAQPRPILRSRSD
jgi:hypothetical protein